MEIIKITQDNLVYYEKILHNTINLYLTIYSAPPYNEKFEFDDILKEFYEYIKDGLLLLAIDSDKVIGFLSTSYGSICDEQLRLSLLSNNINPDTDVYLSEFGVDIRYRCK